MEKGRRYLAVLLMVCAAFFCVACGKEEEDTHAESEKLAQETDAEEPSPESTAALAEQSETGSGSLKERKAGSVIARGGYIETSIGLPEGANDPGCWKTITVLKDGSWAYFDGKTGYFVSDDRGSSWKMKIEGDQEQYVPYASIARDGSLAFIRFTGEGGDRLVFYDKEGNQKEWEVSFPGTDMLYRTAFDEEGNLYVSSMHGKVCRVDQKTGELTQLYMTIQDMGNLYAAGNKLFNLEEHYVEIYDLGRQEMLESDPVLDEFCRDYLDGTLYGLDVATTGWVFAEAEDIVCIACSAGIFRHVLGGSVMEQVVDGQMTSLGDPDGYINAVESLGEGKFLFLPYNGGNVIEIAYDSGQEPQTQSALKIYSLYDNERIRQAVSTFMMEYPEVSVVYEIGMEEDSAVTLTDALKNLNVELMSGNGPDVLLLDGIDASIYADKGLLADLGDLLKDAQEEGALFEKMAGAYRTEQGVFVIPANFKLPLLFGKAEEIRNVKDMATLAQWVQKMQAGTESGTVTGAVTPEQELKQLAGVYGSEWISEKRLDEDAVREFLTQAKAIYDADMAAVSDEMVELLKDWDRPDSIGIPAVYKLIGHARIGFGMVTDVQGDLGAVGKVLEENPDFSFGLWKGRNGAGFVPVNKLAVTVNAKNPEAARKFVTWMLSERTQDLRLSDGLPVNRVSFEKQCAYSEETIMQRWVLPEGEREISFGWPVQSDIDRLKELVEEADICLDTDAVVQEAVLKYGLEVLSGDRIVESALKEISREVSIYLAEQR